MNLDVGPLHVDAGAGAGAGSGSGSGSGGFSAGLNLGSSGQLFSFGLGGSGQGGASDNGDAGASVSLGGSASGDGGDAGGGGDGGFHGSINVHGQGEGGADESAPAHGQGEDASISASTNASMTASTSAALFFPGIAGPPMRFTRSAVPEVTFTTSNSVQVSAVAPPASDGNPKCTVQGGPAKVLYFPPQGQQGSLEANANGGAAPPEPAQGEAFTTLGLTLLPGQAYISCETLFAAYTDDTGSVTQSGPTFTNAIFPFPSEEISTQCKTNVDAKATGAAQYGEGQQLDFGLASAPPSTCMQVVPPTAIMNFAPEWSDYLLWDMEFQAPEQIPCEGAPPASGPTWAGPESQCSCTPTLVAPKTDVVSTPVVTPPPTTSAAGSVSTSTATATRTMTGTHTASTSSVVGSTGDATSGRSPHGGKAGKSLFAVGVLLVVTMVL